MGLGAQILRIQIRAKDSNQRPDLGLFHRRLLPGSHSVRRPARRMIQKVDRASNSKRTDIRVVLTTPKGSIIEQSFTIGFPASNNEVEYEDVLAGI